MKRILPAISLILMTSVQVFSQDGMGIGTLTPHTSSVLEVKSDDKGLLIPRMPSAAINNIPAPAEGLLVFDTQKNVFVYNAANTGTKGWIELSPFPKGIINMWSGPIGDIPTGWGLCNGSRYDSTGAVVVTGNPGFARGTQTPDLSGKFVVSYDASVTEYNAPLKTGGASRVTLTTGQIPAHTHGSGGSHSHTGNTNSRGSHSHSVVYTGAQGKKVGRNSGSGEDGARDASFNANTNATGNHTHSVTLSGGAHTHASVGNGQSHENRPEFFVLAFIMKL